MTTSTPLLSLRDLSVAFRTSAGDVTAVRSVSLDLESGQTLAVVGESGSGKSTTAAAINRLLPGNGRITSGQVLFAGRDLAAVREKEMTSIRGAQIGLVPQDPMSNLNPLQRIGHQIEEALVVHGKVGRRAARSRAIELLEMVGIPEPEKRAAQYPHEFSGGMRQRVLIAIGLACRPRLLIADEPTSALDVTVQRRILDQLALLTEEMGTAVFLITHDLGLAAERADTVVVMRRGEIVEAGDSSSILSNPEHEYTTQLIASVPSLAADRMPSRERLRIAQRPTVPTDATAASTGRPDDDLVKVEHLTKVFTLRGRGGANDFTAVDAVSFTIPRGRTVAIVGESGSGKSTTANLVLSLDAPSSGRILFEGTDVVSLDRTGLFEFRRRVQPVFQNPYASLDPRFTVERSIAEPLAVHRIGDAGSRKARVAELLDQVSLAPALADRLPHELSGGQRQRVAIARALALAPKLVVLDEAVSALDVVVQAQVLELLAELQRELDLSYLFISHDLAVVRMVSDIVHVMQRGRLVESGTPEQIFRAPQEAYTQELLAAIPHARRVA